MGERIKRWTASTDRSSPGNSIEGTRYNPDYGRAVNVNHLLPRLTHLSPKRPQRKRPRKGHWAPVNPDDFKDTCLPDEGYHTEDCPRDDIV